LSYRNAGQNAEVTREELRQALKRFSRLPAGRRNPGAVAVGESGRPDPNYARTPPAGGLVVRVHTRILDSAGGAFRRGACGTTGGDAAARDVLWLTRDEVQKLAPAKVETGFTYDVPQAIADRLLRFHLVDNTRGEPPFWKREHVRRGAMKLRVVRVTAEGVEVRLDGDALLATDSDLRKADRGYEARLRGDLRYVPGRRTFDRFDVAAVGEHWGESALTRGARPGRSLLGVAFGPVAGASSVDHIPPQAARDLATYFGKDRP
jgi:hypothetical protein